MKMGVDDEELGQIEAAEQQYRALADGQAVDVDSRRDAVLGPARLRLLVDPAAAAAMLAILAAPTLP